jgi:imidazolonepropionase-like amidohydrolase
MAPMHALRSATKVGADALGFSGDLGSIEIGKLADIILLENDPLIDIKNTAKIKYVMKNGILYDAKSLDTIWPVKREMGPQYWHNNSPINSNN